MSCSEKNFKKRCKFCKKHYVIYFRKVKRKFCSVKCFHLSRRNRKKVRCDYCRNIFERAISKFKQSRSGFLFCRRRCKELAQKLSSSKKFDSIRPYKNKQGTSTYRKRAIEYYGSRCRICRYNIESVLEVHHKDGNRNNNKMKNLDVLCPTHHKEYEQGIRKY